MVWQKIQKPLNHNWGGRYIFNKERKIKTNGHIQINLELGISKRKWALKLYRKGSKLWYHYACSLQNVMKRKAEGSAQKK